MSTVNVATLRNVAVQSSCTVGHPALIAPPTTTVGTPWGFRAPKTTPWQTSCVKISMIFLEFLPLDNTFNRQPIFFPFIKQYVCHVKLCSCYSVFTQTTDLSVLDGEHITRVTLHITEHVL